MSINEEELVAAAKADPQAFGILFDYYYPPISTYILHRVSDTAAGQDIISIVFFKAWHGLPKYQHRGVPFSAWLYRIASNEINTYFRQKKYLPLSLEALFEASHFEPPSSQDVEQDLIAYQDALLRHKDFLLVQSLIQSLPLKYQEILALRFFEKKSIKDIADITGKNINTVKSLLSRGTAKLQKTFKDQKDATFET